MDVGLRNGNSNTFEFLGQVGFNGFELGAEGPLSKKKKNASFLINYRYSTLGLLHDIGIDFGTGTAVPKYHDINLKLNIPTEKAGTFSIWGLGGTSDIAFFASEGSDNLYSANNENLNSRSTTGILGIGHKYFFTEKTSSNISMALSKTRNRNTREKNNSATPNEFQTIFDGNSKQDLSLIHI